MLTTLLSRRSFGDLAGWGDGDHRAALAAFRRSAERFLAEAVDTGSLGVDAASFRPAAIAATTTDDTARRFFETHFVPAFLAPSPTGGSGFLTGYYEPEVEARLVPDARFRWKSVV